MELIYLWISKYKNIENQGFRFSNNYIIEHAFEAFHKINIEENKQAFKRKIFGEKIQNITVLVGENGAGKTSLLECLSIVGFDLWKFIANIHYYNGIVYTNSNINDLYNKGFFDFIIIYKNEYNDIIIKSNIEQIELPNPYKNDFIDVLSQKSLLYSTSTFKINDKSNPKESGCSGGYVIGEYSTTEEPILKNGILWGGIYNTYKGDFYRSKGIQDKFRESKSIDKIGLVDKSLYNIPFNSFEDLKNKFQFIKTWKNLNNTLVFPKFIKLSFINKIHKLDSYDKEGASKIINLFKGFTLDNNIEDKYIYASILINYFYFIIDFFSSYGINEFYKILLIIEDEFEKKFTSGMSLESYIYSNIFDNGIEDIEYFFIDNRIEEIKDFFIDKINKYGDSNMFISAKSYIELFKLLAELWQVITKQNSIYLSLDNQSHIDLINRFLELPCRYKNCENEKYVFFKEEDIEISFYMDKHIANEWRPSTGEVMLLTQLARILKADIQPNFIIIDECEIGLHPELQRKYLSIIIDAINKYVTNPIHLILTTHSPFILSDIPSQYIIFFEKGNKANCLINQKALSNYEQTFATNIHQLLSQSFFMKNGLIGEFAKNKIKEVLDILNGNMSIDFEYCQDIINLIGEPILKYKLQQKYDEVYLNFKGIDSKIQALKEEIAQLESLKNTTM